MEQPIHEILDFYYKYGNNSYNRYELSREFTRHIKYGTLFVFRDKSNGIMGLLRVNIYGEKAHALDLVIHPKYRSLGFVRFMASVAWRAFPYVSLISYERGTKYPSRERVCVDIKKFIGLEKEKMIIIEKIKEEKYDGR